MGKKMTWEDMKKIYPDEWLLIVDFESDDSGHIVSGIVERHSKDKDDVYRLPALNKPTAFRYTGESDFAGLRTMQRNITSFDTSRHHIYIEPTVIDLKGLKYSP